MLRLRFVLISQLALASLPAADIEFITQELPWAVVDKGYAPPPLESRTSGACNSGGIGYAVVSGSLPPGLQLSKLGYFSGVPLRTGSFEVAIRVSTGCSWTTRHFTLISTGQPILSVTPDKITVRSSAKDAKSFEEALHVSATWPKLAYRVESSVGWLTATSERGFTPRETSGLASDVVRVRIDPARLPPGKHHAIVSLSAWQAETPRVPVELTVVE